MGNFVLSGKTDNGGSYRPEVLGSNPAQYNFFFPFYLYRKSWDTLSARNQR